MRTHLLMSFGALFAQVAIQGCSSAVPVTTPGPAAEASVSASAPQVSRWSGSFVPVNDKSADVGMRGAVRSYGIVSLTPGVTADWTHVDLHFGGYKANTLGWALVPGRCGSDAAPILPANAFPLLDVTSGGNAQVATDLHTPFPTDGSYHIKIYKADGVVNQSAQGLAGVISCSNLRYQQ